MGMPLASPRRRAVHHTGVLCLCLSLMSCGAGGAGAAKAGSRAHPERVTLILDFIPNAVHAGIYRALAAGYYRAQGIDLRVIQPASTSQTLALMDAGKVQFGLADGADVAEQIDRGSDARAVMAIAQRPLGGLITLASEHLRSPCQLTRRLVGLTGVPSDRALLDTEVRHDGCDPSRVKTVTVGFNGAQDLAGGRLVAFTGFWPDDGVQLSVTGHRVTTFKLDENGGPAYPGLVAFTSRRVMSSRPGLVRSFLAATAHGYRDTIADPQRSLTDLLRLNPTINRALAAASLRVYLPLFTDGGRVRFGTLQPGRLRAMSAWLLRYHLIRRAISARRYASGRS